MKNCILVALTVVTACADPVASAGGNGEAVAVPRASDGLTVWYGDTQAGVFGPLHDPGRAHEVYDARAIVPTAISFGSYATALVTAFGAETPPDIFVTSHLAGQAFADMGYVEPICANGECEACEGDGAPGWCDVDRDGDGRGDDPAAAAVALGSDQGLQAIGVPLYWEFPIVLANPGWLDAHDVDAPATIDDLGKLTRDYPDAVFHDASWFFAQNRIALGGVEVPDFNSLYSTTPELEDTALLIVHTSNVSLMRETYGAEFDAKMVALDIADYAPAVSVLAAYVPDGPNRTAAIELADSMRRAALALTHDPMLELSPLARVRAATTELAQELSSRGAASAICIGRKGATHDAACTAAAKTLAVVDTERPEDAELPALVAALVDDGAEAFLATDPRTAVALDEALIDAGADDEVVVASLGRSPQLLGHMAEYGAEAHVVAVAAQSRSTLIPAAAELHDQFASAADSGLEADMLEIGAAGDSVPGIDAFNPGEVLGWTWSDFAQSVATSAYKQAAVGAVSDGARGAAHGAVVGAVAGAAEYIYRQYKSASGVDFGQFSELAPETALDN